MLNKSLLEKQILLAITESLEPALEEGMRCTFMDKSERSESQCKDFASTATNIFAKTFAPQLASAIDTYIKTASLYGTIITSGSPATQTAIINSPKYIVNGKVPNTVGIR